MIDLADPVLLSRWFPLARVEEAPPRHVLHAMLLGREIAVWRADDGRVNAWENRCPHRGVRFSIGLNLGLELKCQYHGWRFASDDGRCTYIPAHPSMSPPPTIRAAPYAVAEQDGFIWAAVAPPSGRPPSLAAGLASLTLRSVFVEAPTADVARDLVTGGASNDDLGTVTARDDFTLDVVAQGADAPSRVVLLLQPVSPVQTLIHAALISAFDPADGLAIRRAHAQRLNAARDAIEARYRLELA
jgi:nitrite reductase/ring-hydroxylating ferredoxin subunit